MPSFLNRKAREIITKHIESNCIPIRVTPGLCRMNFKCHLNAVHDAMMMNERCIFMVMYIDGIGDNNPHPMIHFVNQSKDGVYIDNTLGWWSTRMRYYSVKRICRDDFDSIVSILGDQRKKLRAILPWWVRLFSNYKC